MTTLNELLLCSWSSIVIFVVMFGTKYRFTAPTPVTALVVFAVVGGASGIGAGTINAFIGRETQFWFFSNVDFYRAMGFLLGAGLGEEFWKFSLGLVVMIGLLGLRRDLNAHGWVLGFTLLGLAFATLENLLAYSDLNAWLLFTRGFSAVPMHASMGLLHGLGAALAWRRRAFWPLLITYLLTAGLHTLYDLLPVIVARGGEALGWQAPDAVRTGSVFAMSGTLLLGLLVVWWRLPELEPGDCQHGRREGAPPLPAAPAMPEPPVG